MKDHSPRRRMKAFPQPKTDEVERANSEVTLRPMTPEELERMKHLKTYPKPLMLKGWSK